MVVDMTPVELALWFYKEIKNNKKQAKYNIPRLLLPVIAKMKIKENAGLGLIVEPCLDLGQTELLPFSLKTT